MAPNLFLLFNHQITEVQSQDAHRSLGVEGIVALPRELQDIWSNIPPECPEINPVLESIKKWLAERASPGDFVLIQGDFGACHLMVNFAVEHGLNPVYSTNRRDACEEREEDGTVKLVHFFRHEIFRLYGR